jgi:hypothetical protein
MLRLTRVRIPAESCDVTQLVSFLPPRLRHSGHPQLGPRWRDDHQAASEMVWQSPLVVAKPPFPDDDPRWRLPGYNRMRKKEPKLWKGLKTLADRLWDADVPESDLSCRERLRSPVLVEAIRILWT